MGFQCFHQKQLKLDAVVVGSLDWSTASVGFHRDVDSKNKNEFKILFLVYLGGHVVAKAGVSVELFSF